MTSSWSLSQRKKMKDVWSISNFGDPNNPLGGWEDHYITPGGTHECHPNYQAVPIGDQYGFMVCRKKKREDGRGIDTPTNDIDPSVYNGYNKYQADMYRPWRKTQIQMTNPRPYYDRTTPNEQILRQRDYIARGIQYDGTGTRPKHTPGDRPYMEYGYSYSDNPPYKYDVTLLHQKYPVWKNEQKFRGSSQQDLDNLDIHHNENITSSTW